MKIRFLWIILFMALVVLGVGIISAGKDDKVVLNEGKNHVKIDRQMLASEFISLNPAIKSVSYYDEFLERTNGYVNIFGGMGRDFYLEEGETYEVFSDANVTVHFPLEE